MKVGPKKAEITITRQARIFDIRHVLIGLLQRFINQKMVVLSSQLITLYFSNWWEEAAVISHGLLACLVGFLFTEGTFVPNSQFDEVTKMKPWMLAFVYETMENIARFRKKEAAQVFSLSGLRLLLHVLCFALRNISSFSTQRWKRISIFTYNPQSLCSLVRIL